MYLGEIIEIANTDTIFENALHPYTIALLSAVPKIELGSRVQRIILKGDVASPINPGAGCRFAPRCWMSQDICREKSPALQSAGEMHSVACHFYNDSQQLAEQAQKKTVS